MTFESQVVMDLKSQLTDVQIKQEQMDLNLKQLLNNNLTQSEKSGDKDKGRDRTRLKERLKKASLKATKQTLQQGAGWLASIFGITPGDRRVGIGRSRWKFS
jgi:hypothetical protein